MPGSPGNLALCVFLMVGLCFGEISTPLFLFALTPDQLVVLVNDSDLDSVSLGRYYIQRRGIPRSHLIALDLPTRESISRKEFEEEIVVPLRKALSEKKLSENTRAITTVYGVPLKIQSPTATPQEERWRNDAIEWQRATLKFLHDLLSQLKELSESPSPEVPFTQEESTAANSDYKPLIQSTVELLFSTHRYLSLQQDSPTLRKKNETFAKIKRQLLGHRALLTSLNPAPRSQSPEDSPSSLQKEIQTATTLVTLLSQVPSDKNREQAYELTQRYLGLLGVLTLTMNEIDRFSLKQADASLDSELSLLWYDFGEYSLSHRLPNPLFAWDLPPLSVDHKSDRGESPILMVGRIDAPTPSLAKQMVENAIHAEKLGILGNAYIDARGLYSDQELSYGDYDESLRTLARLLIQRSAYPVRLENTDRRFSQIGEAPSVGIYAGWYRYRQYENAFTFNPGAIGFHIASGEAISIHTRNEPGWCKNALERGITVTLGPTNEPYLDAFPKPSDFFALMFTGQYSLVEAYYLTTRYVSWRMVLFGDPLYNPWKGSPLVSLADLRTDLSSFSGFSQLPPSPSTRHVQDPARGLYQRVQQRQRLLQEIPILLRR